MFRKLWDEITYTFPNFNGCTAPEQTVRTNKQTVWTNDQNAGDLRRHCAYYDVTVMNINGSFSFIISICLCRHKVDKRSEMQIHYFITSHKFSRSLLLWFMDSGDANDYIIHRSCFCCPGSKYIYTWTSVKCREISLFSSINPFLPSAAYMPQWIGSALVQTMACRLFSDKPLSKLMLRWFQLGTNFSEILVKI